MSTGVGAGVGVGVVVFPTAKPTKNVTVATVVVKTFGFFVKLFSFAFIA